GTAVAVLAQESETTALVVNPDISDKPTETTLPELMARLSGETLSLARRVMPSVAGDAPSQAATSRHGHWFWGPIVRMRWVYL
ncbi:hypothetical protein JZU57_02275, partial [bacterium]|nr:hypothetical protein [bacterium]